MAVGLVVDYIFHIVYCYQRQVRHSEARRRLPRRTDLIRLAGEEIVFVFGGVGVTAPSFGSLSTRENTARGQCKHTTPSPPPQYCSRGSTSEARGGEGI